MRFINPKTDFAFKKIFGSEQSPPILRSFLNAILYAGEPVIESLTIVDPYSIPRLQGMKDTFVDVRATLHDGQRVIIEMQVLNVRGLEKRILYNAAKEYSAQLEKGADYTLLNPVIALTITDFVFFENAQLETQALSRFVLREKETMITYPDGDVELVFLELPKWPEKPVVEQSLTDKWVRFLNEAPDLDWVPAELGSVEEIGQAFEIAERAGLTAEEERLLEAKRLSLATMRNLESDLQVMRTHLEEQQQRVKEEQQRVEEERQRAEEERRRADRLAERLRELGEDV
ncbi:MAG: Rpn family recombination-promoting nuclease/putative transposase [Verrucomicrobiales bacterium]